MSHYVAYHNPDSMNYTAEEITGFGVLTNKSPRADLQGSTIWLITGQGKPRRYSLAQRFTADIVESGEDEGFATRIAAQAGDRFSPMLPLDDEDWFADLKRTVANFSLGLQRITDERFIRGLEEVASRGTVQ